MQNIFLSGKTTVKKFFKTTKNKQTNKKENQKERKETQILSSYFRVVLSFNIGLLKSSLTLGQHIYKYIIY